MNYLSYASKISAAVTMLGGKVCVISEPGLRCRISILLAVKGYTCTIISPKVLHRVWEEEINDLVLSKENFVLSTPHAVRYEWEEVISLESGILIMEFDNFGPSMQSKLSELFSRHKYVIVRNLCRSSRLYAYLHKRGFVNVFMRS